MLDAEALSDNLTQSFPELKKASDLPRIEGEDWEAVHYAMILVVDGKGAFCLSVGDTVAECRTEAVRFLFPTSHMEMYNRTNALTLAAISLCAYGESLMMCNADWYNERFTKLMICLCEPKLYIMHGRYRKSKVIDVVFDPNLPYNYARFAGLDKEVKISDLRRYATRRESKSSDGSGGRRQAPDCGGVQEAQRRG